MSTVKMQYHGPAHKLTRTIQLPVPFVQHSVNEGSVEFVNGFGDVPKQHVESLEKLGVFTVAKEESCQSQKKK